jgi:hypothetical protein
MAGTLWLRALSVLVGARGLPQAAGAQGSPVKLVTQVVGDPAGDAFPAGRDADLVARELAKQLSERRDGSYGAADNPGMHCIYEWLRATVSRWEYPRHIAVTNEERRSCTHDQ